MFEMIVKKVNKRAAIAVLAVCAAAAILVLSLSLRPVDVVDEDAGPCSRQDLAALTSLKETLPLSLPVLMNMWQQLDPDFSIDEFKCLDVEQLDEVPAGPAKVEGNEDDRMLVTSPDQKRSLDLSSYHWDLRVKNGEVQAEVLEPDTAVMLMNRAGNERKRLLFLGTDAGVDDAVWIDDSAVAIVGYQEALDESGVGGRGAEPLLWIIRLDQGKVAIFGGRAATGYDPREYVVRKYALARGER